MVDAEPLRPIQLIDAHLLTVLQDVSEIIIVGGLLDACQTAPAKGFPWLTTPGKVRPR